MLIRKVEKFMRDHDMPATKFGRLAAKDPRFVLDLRLGRTPRPRTEKRTREWMAEYEARISASRPDIASVPASAPASARTSGIIAARTFGAIETKEFSHAV